MKIHKSERAFIWANNLLMLLFSCIIIYPFLNVLAISLNDGRDAMRGGIHIFPRVFSLQAYEPIFMKSALLQAFTNSILRTAIGTILGLAFTALLGYILANKKLIFRRLIIFYFVFTMYFAGGMIPDYILIRNLNLINKFIVYIVPSLFVCWNTIIMRSFFEGLPESLKEAARIDGASEWRTFWQIILPISKPVLATVALFIMVGQWNAWYDTYIYTNKPELITLQGILVQILTESQAQYLSNLSTADMVENARKPTPETIKMATIIVTTLPIVFVYPLLQKYFVKGIMIGAVKG